MKIEMNFNNYEMINNIIDESTINDFRSLLNQLFGCARNKFGDDEIRKELLKPYLHLKDFMGWK